MAGPTEHANLGVASSPRRRVALPSVPPQDAGVDGRLPRRGKRAAREARISRGFLRTIRQRRARWGVSSSMPGLSASPDEPTSLRSHALESSAGPATQSASRGGACRYRQWDPGGGPLGPEPCGSTRPSADPGPRVLAPLRLTEEGVYVSEPAEESAESSREDERANGENRPLDEGVHLGEHSGGQRG